MSRFLLVPGYWLGAWAWDEVVAELEAAGQRVSAISLPGLERAEEDRSQVHMEDHITAIAEAIRSAGEDVLLVVHSGAGMSGYAAADRVPERVARIIYVDSGPGTGAPMNAEFPGIDYPLPDWDALEEDGSSLEGLDEAALARFREHSLPQPGNVIREGFELRNPARLEIPSTVICTSTTVEQVQEWVEAGAPFVAELANVKAPIDWVDLPTGHWPMWSEPQRLAAELLRYA